MGETTTSDSEPLPGGPGERSAANRRERWGVYAAALAFPAMTLSISATQILIALSFICFAAGWFFARRSNPRRGLTPAATGQAPSIKGSSASRIRNAVASRLRETPPVWLAGGALFVWLFFSGIIHSVLDALAAASLAESARAFADAIRRGAGGEWGDVPLFLFGLLVYRHALRADFRRILFGGLIAALALLLLGGLGAVFSEFRLARSLPHFIREIFQTNPAELTASAANRPQHPFASLAGWTIYRPIGFMNTRLTFAGLLLLLLPWAAGRAIWPAARPAAASNDPTNNSEAGKRFASFRSGFRGLSRAAWAAAVGLGASLLILNGTRSILLGAGVTACLAGWLYLRACAWSKLRVLAASFSIGAILVSSYSFSDAVRLRSDRAFARVQRHTDFARPILWTVAGSLGAQRPVLGVGPGNFERAGLEWREAFVREHPETLYFFRNTPRGHAHNDLLHLAATGGLPAALLFLALIFFTTRLLFDAHVPGHPQGGTPRDRWLLLGAVGFFVAGVAQCYFQDDEVTTLYWALLGLATARATARDSSHADNDTQAADQRSEN
ncbi:MAG: O-antigen ligase family protein [Leptospirales bacterium]